MVIFRAEAVFVSFVDVALFRYPSQSSVHDFSTFILSVYSGKGLTVNPKYSCALQVIHSTNIC